MAVRSPATRLALALAMALLWAGVAPQASAAAAAKRRPHAATPQQDGRPDTKHGTQQVGKPGPAAAAGPTARPGAAAHGLRLGNQVQPHAAWLALAIDPAQPRYNGTAEYDISIAQPLSDIVLHAKGLKVQDAWLDAGARRLAAKVTVLDSERISLRFAKPLAAGKARLGLAFAGQLQAPERSAKPDDLAARGQVRQAVDGRWLVHTRFLPTGARLAFPGFDEPGWKLPWTLSLSAPQGYEALANMPTPAAEPADRAGWLTWRFAPTAPMASHGLAWALGQWAVQDGPAVGELPLRFIQPAGLGASPPWAAELTSALVSALEAYLDQPLPAAKLDSLLLPGVDGPTSAGAAASAASVPGAAPGPAAAIAAMPGARPDAMANAGSDPAAQPGLFSYDRGLLAPAGLDDVAAQRRYLASAAQALAQQWFGQLVGVAWWDDWWLNQALAAVVADQVVQEIRPDWHWQAQRQPQARAQAMAADQRPDARSLQQAVASDGDLARLGSPASRDKGLALLAMAQGWMGADAWRDSLRRHIQRHAWGQAAAADFLRTLGEADAQLPVVLGRFAQQPGVPLLQVQAVCDDGPPRLQLRQLRLGPAGQTEPGREVGQTSQPGPPWPLPLRLRTAAGELRLLMTDDSATLPLTGQPCPAWVQANVGGQGYYRVAYGPGLGTLPAGLTEPAGTPGATAGAGDPLASPDSAAPRFLQSTAELLALLDDAGALHQAGLLDSATLRLLAQAYGADGRPQVAQAVAALPRP